jgi:hypothetical protein
VLSLGDVFRVGDGVIGGIALDVSAANDFVSQLDS